MNPEKFDVVALTNLNGDYASDALAAQVGGIGISLEPTLTIKQAMLFLKQHMEQLQISRIKIRLTLAQFLLSGCMLLDYIGWTEAAQLITSAIEKTFKADIFTADLAFGKQAYSTSAFSNQILSIM